MLFFCSKNRQGEGPFATLNDPKADWTQGLCSYKVATKAISGARGSFERGELVSVCRLPSTICAWRAGELLVPCGGVQLFELLNSVPGRLTSSVSVTLTRPFAPGKRLLSPACFHWCWPNRNAVFCKFSKVWWRIKESATDWRKTKRAAQPHNENHVTLTGWN